MDKPAPNRDDQGSAVRGGRDGPGRPRDSREELSHAVDDREDQFAEFERAAAMVRRAGADATP